MQLLFAAVKVLIVTSCALSGYLAEEHLVPKHGLESRHSIVKRDISEADMEMILKALMTKLDHKVVDTELMHKQVGLESGHYSYEPEIAGEVHYVNVKEKELKHPSYPMEYEYMKETFPHEEIKKDIGTADKDMKAFSMKLKELGIDKVLAESDKKDIYHGIPEEKYVSEKVHFSEDPILIEESDKMYEETPNDKFSDKDVSLAESLYHMKIAGDIETYPSIKMAPLHDIKVAEEKLHLEKAGIEESYLKKVDEIGKTLLKEEHVKDGDIEAYLKKVAEEEKSLFYEPKIAHSEIGIKNTEEKALEAWKDDHKDIFLAEGAVLDEKFLKEGTHHKEEGISHEIKEELIKKLKALGLDKELGKEDELLHALVEEFHKKEEIAEGSIAYEKAKDQAHKDAHIHLSEEEMKKYIDEVLAFEEKEKGLATDLFFEKGLTEEKIHGINTKIGADIDKSLHGIIGEEAFKSEKAFKSEEAFKSKETHALDETYGFGKEKAKFGGKIPLAEAEIKHGIADSEKTFKVYGEEALKKEKTFGVDALLHKVHEEELFKKDKALGADAFLHKAHEDELLKKEKAYGTDPFFHKEDELVKKEKAYGTDPFLHKVHEDELLKKEKAYDVDFALHKSHDDELIKKDIAYGSEDFLHKAHEDELLKKEKTYGTDAFFRKIYEDELLKKEKGFQIDSALHKAHEDELKKKEFAFGSDALLHKDKDILVSVDEHHEKSHKTIHDLKAKFFELLRRVLRTRKCHLVTMRPGELLGIVNCVSRSKSPLLCEKFSVCEKKMPPRVIATLEKCQKETIPGEIKKCTRYAPLYPSTEIPLKIFQCVAINTRELTPDEKKKMIEFEECARIVKAEGCSRFKFLPHPH